MSRPAGQSPDFYQVLGVSKGANDQEIKAGYRKQSLLHHPDKNRADPRVAEDKFKQISEAYNTLSDPTKRAAYDHAENADANARTFMQMQHTQNSRSFTFSGRGKDGSTFSFTSYNTSTGPVQGSYGGAPTATAAEELLQKMWNNNPTGFGGGPSTWDDLDRHLNDMSARMQSRVPGFGFNGFDKNGNNNGNINTGDNSGNNSGPSGMFGSGFQQQGQGNGQKGENGQASMDDNDDFAGFGSSGENKSKSKSSGSSSRGQQQQGNNNPFDSGNSSSSQSNHPFGGQQQQGAFMRQQSSGGSGMTDDHSSSTSSSGMEFADVKSPRPDGQSNNNPFADNNNSNSSNGNNKSMHNSSSSNHPFGSGMNMNMNMNSSATTNTSSSMRAQAPANMYDLKLTLEELFAGVTKRMKIERKRLDGRGQLVHDPKLLEIQVKPGWRAGTRITFAREGDEHFSGSVIPADIIFTVEELPHPRFGRKGDNLYYRHSLLLREALCGPCFEIRTLDNRKLTIDCRNDPPIHPKYRKKVIGEGMPVAAFSSQQQQGGAGQQQMKERGDLIIEFEIQFPMNRLTDMQKNAIMQLL